MFDLLGFWTTLTLLVAPVFWVAGAIVVSLVDWEVGRISNGKTTNFTDRFDFLDIFKHNLFLLPIQRGFPLVLWTAASLVMLLVSVIAYLEDGYYIVHMYAGLSELLAPVFGWVGLLLGGYFLVHFVLKKMYTLSEKIDRLS
jgi:hypothetical protein